MKAVLFSIGTRGDMEPFLAIAELLKEKGWDVLCVFPEQFRETVEEMGFRFEGFTKEFLKIMDAHETKMVMAGQGSVFKRIKILIKISRTGIRLSNEMVGLQYKVLKDETPYRVLYHPKCNYNILWGMANPGKSIMVSPIPFLGHTVDYLTTIGGEGYGKIINRFTFWFTNTMKAIMIKKSVKRFKNDYKGLKTTTTSIKKAMLQKEKSFYPVSPSLFPRPDYWPSCANVVGYYERDKTVNWKPDAQLEQFINKYKKIVFITFGSMSNPNPKEKTQMIVDILKRNNISAIINTSWGGLEELEEYPDHIHFVSNIPYDWIFPKMYAIVHHGGSGTTHTALKYGCPSLIIPHIVDQFYWNRTTSKLNLGPKGMPIKKLNEKDFESKMLDLINNETYRKNVKAISESMKVESNKEKLYKMIVNVF